MKEFWDQKMCIRCEECPPVDGQTMCRPCKKLYMREYRAKKKAADRLDFSRPKKITCRKCKAGNYPFTFVSPTEGYCCYCYPKYIELLKRQLSQ